MALVRTRIRFLSKVRLPRGELQQKRQQHHTLGRYGTCIDGMMKAFFETHKENRLAFIM